MGSISPTLSPGFTPRSDWAGPEGLTAHFEGGRVEFSYPPTWRTFQETLKEVQRCTRERITINTFMLERSYALTSFVEQMAKINRGRAFFATPESLGEYILVDYVKQKRQTRRTAS